ncbi:hypothetical protein [Neobacillus sp. YIM B06451]|uniref:hypothetical protein n=1 Tax=Neobacillus sp. YIM B06451 TaxID=3070994 RepID=UPI00292DB411|nr:hypothetical protein [Neobacillus sp. YIM B06451]
MKKMFAGMFLVLSLIVVFSVSASTPSPKVEINGVKVYSPYNHQKKGDVFVDVEAFFSTLNQAYTLNHNKKTVTFENQTININNFKEGYVASFDDLANSVEAAGYTAMATKEDGSVYLLVLPKGVMKLTPSVPKMGEHWAIPSNMPLGPIYGVEKGKLVFIEQMPAQEVFTKGESIVDLDGMKGLPSPGIDHTNIEFQEHGHEGFEVPHYDIHHYFITPQERDAIEGDIPPH